MAPDSACGDEGGSFNIGMVDPVGTLMDCLALRRFLSSDAKSSCGFGVAGADESIFLSRKSPLAMAFSMLERSNVSVIVLRGKLGDAAGELPKEHESLLAASKTCSWVRVEL